MFKKGVSGNPAGRPGGVANLATKQIREAVTQIVNNNLLQLQKDLEGMNPEARIRCLVSLMDFVLPKLQRMQIEADEGVNIVINETKTYDAFSWFEPTICESCKKEQQ